MKRLLSYLLLLALCLLLWIPALGAEAPKVQVSAQRLSVDGTVADCEKYNIDGSNYFKLRDLAMLLRGTPAAFAVSFDTAEKQVFVERGGDYEPVGTELTPGEDRSDSCPASVWTLFVDGKQVEVSTYNIGGSNFYKLRDLGSILRFAVDYDPGSNTSYVFSDYDHTAVTDSKVPVGEVKGWTFSEPAEQKPEITCRYGGEGGEILQGKVTYSAPEITRSQAEKPGFVTYTVRFTETGSIALRGITDLDAFYTSSTSYAFWDYYTGVAFMSRPLAKNSSYDDHMLVSFHGKSYSASYTLTYRDTGNFIAAEAGISMSFNAVCVYRITVPAAYDGLVLALRRGEISLQNGEIPEIYTTEDLAYEDSTAPWNDDAHIDNWVFIRVADWAVDDY